jgi:hypothetical protein
MSLTDKFLTFWLTLNKNAVNVFVLETWALAENWLYTSVFGLKTIYWPAKYTCKQETNLQIGLKTIIKSAYYLQRRAQPED